MKIIYRERWKHVRWTDSLPIIKALLKGEVTSPSGKGTVERFEAAFSKLCGTSFALAMNSGTAALHSALFAVGVEPGDEVILPSYTWHATASAVLCCGAKPVFCDIDCDTLTMDPNDVLKRVTSKTKALLPVHVWGNPCEMDKILEIAAKHDLRIVEDCSHAHGAFYKGKSVGSWGDIGCFSLQGSKAVSAGEGGIAVCSDPVYFDRMLALGHPVRSASGMKSGTIDIGGGNLGPKYRPHLFGILLAEASLRRLPALNRLRLKNWQLLCEKLSHQTLVRPIKSFPDATAGGFLEFKLILQIEKIRGGRDSFIAAARELGLPVSADRYGHLDQIGIFQGGKMTNKLVGQNLSSSPRALNNILFLENRIITLPAFTDVPRGFIEDCAHALAQTAKDLSGSR